MCIKLAVAVKEKEDLKIYREALRHYDVQLSFTDSLTGLYKMLMCEAYNGVILDVPTKLSATSEERMMVRDALGTYPVCICKADIRTGTVRVLINEEQVYENRMDHFIYTQCRSFPERKIRKAGRSELNFKAVCIDEQSGRQADAMEKTVTLNVSSNGVFLYGVSDKKVGEKVRFVIQDLQDKTPICGVVRWQTKWEGSTRIPGYGIEFREVTPTQLEQISSLVLTTRSRRPASFAKA